MVRPIPESGQSLAVQHSGQVKQRLGVRHSGLRGHLPGVLPGLSGSWHTAGRVGGTYKLLSVAGRAIENGGDLGSTAIAMALHCDMAVSVSTEQVYLTCA